MCAKTSLKPSLPTKRSCSSQISVYLSWILSSKEPIVLDLIISDGNKSKPRLFNTEKTLNADDWLGDETTTKKHLFNTNWQNLIKSSSLVNFSLNLTWNTWQFFWIWTFASLSKISSSNWFNPRKSNSCIYLLKNDWSFSRKNMRGCALIISNWLPFSCK